MFVAGTSGKAKMFEISNTKGDEEPTKVVTEFDLKKSPSKVRFCESNANFFAAGGKEFDLTVWDVEQNKVSWTARNVCPHL